MKIRFQNRQLQGKKASSPYLRYLIFLEKGNLKHNWYQILSFRILEIRRQREKYTRYLINTGRLFKTPWVSIHKFKAFTRYVVNITARREDKISYSSVIVARTDPASCQTWKNIFWSIPRSWRISVDIAIKALVWLEIRRNMRRRRCA